MSAFMGDANVLLPYARVFYHPIAFYTGCRRRFFDAALFLTEQYYVFQYIVYFYQLYPANARRDTHWFHGAHGAPSFFV